MRAPSCLPKEGLCDDDASFFFYRGRSYLSAPGMVHEHVHVHVHTNYVLVGRTYARVFIQIVSTRARKSIGQ